MKKRILFLIMIGIVFCLVNTLYAEDFVLRVKKSIYGGQGQEIFYYLNQKEIAKEVMDETSGRAIVIGKIPDGIVKSFYASGKVFEKLNFVQNEPSGAYEQYYENGKLLAKGNYLLGRLEGPYEVYFENTQIKEKFFYKDGLIEGSSVKYYENGQVQQQSTYLAGKLEGYIQTYD